MTDQELARAILVNIDGEPAPWQIARAETILREHRAAVLREAAEKVPARTMNWKVNLLRLATEAEEGK